MLPGALARLRDAGHDVRLDIVGPVVGQAGESERAAIERLAAEHRVADRLTCVGAMPLERLLPLYREHDLFVLPTGPGEGIPRVLLEAMAAGLPIVTTRVSGIPSLVSADQNGVLLEAGDEASIARGVGRILADATLRQRLIRGGYDTAAAHTLERQAAEMIRVLAARNRADCVRDAVA
jgi:glycosyltransferase involved in cell wall biosynthesis